MDKVIDMHIHSSNSDGEYEVKDLVKMIREAGINLFSITDHDSIKSVEDINACDLADLEYIKGVEISSTYKGINMHLLGYDFEVTDVLKDMLLDIQEKRKKRFYETLYLIEKNEGVSISDQVLESVINNSESLARPHIINILMNSGYGDNRDLVYRSLVKKYRSSIQYRVYLEDVVNILNVSKAKIILAHPKEIEDEYKIDIDSILPDLIDFGLDGIEVYNSIHTAKDIIRYQEYVNKYNLDYTGGSDYHGPNVKKLVKLGHCSKDGVKVNKVSLR